MRRTDRPHHTKADENAAVCQTELRAAHNDTFDRICQYVDTEVLEGKKVVRVAMLRDMYLQHMATNHADVYNPDYTSQKLKAKLTARFGQHLTFWLPQPTCKSELVFSSQLDTGEAVETAFDASTSETKILHEAAAILCRQIKQVHSSAADMQILMHVTFVMFDYDDTGEIKQLKPILHCITAYRTMLLYRSVS